MEPQRCSKCGGGRRTLNQETLDRYQGARSRWKEADARLEEGIENLINSSDLNDRTYVLTTVGSLASLQVERDEAWAEYVRAEGELMGELHKGLFPGQHRSG